MPLPSVKLGNTREKTFSEVWFQSEVLKNLRDFNKLEENAEPAIISTCAGLPRRAYGLSSDFIDFCGDLNEPAELRGNYLAEDPWCVYEPGKDLIQPKKDRYRFESCSHHCWVAR